MVTNWTVNTQFGSIDFMIILTDKMMLLIFNRIFFLINQADIIPPCYTL